MKTALIYASKTGHSKKLADAIAKELKITAQNIKSQPKFDNTDLLFIVGGIYGGKSSPELMAYVNQLDNKKVKKAVLVTSCTSKKTKQDEIRQILQEKSIVVSDKEFICQGSFLFMGMGHPNKTEINQAVDFVKSNF